MPKTIQVAKQLTRAATLEKDEKGKLRISISSTAPYKRFDWGKGEYYWEVLSHKPEGISDVRLKEGLSVLFNHDRDQHLGRSTQYENTGERVYVGTIDDIKWASSQFAQDKKKDVESGALVGTSVGYSIDKKAGAKVGEKDGLPVYEFRWEPYEFSFCTVEADISVGAGREGNMPECRTIEILGEDEIVVDANQENNHKSQSQSTADTNSSMKIKSILTGQVQPSIFREGDTGGNSTAGSSNAGGSATASLDIKTAVKDHFAMLRKKWTKMDEWVENLRDEGWKRSAKKIAEKYRGMEDFNFDDFREEALNAFGKGGDDNSGRVQIISEPGDVNHGSRTRGGIITPGEAFVQSELYRQAQGQRKRNFSVEIPGMQNFRATATTATITNFNGIVQFPDIITLGVQQAHVADLLSQGTTNLNAVPYIQEDTFTNAVTNVAEGAAKPEFTWDWSQTSAPVKKIAGFSKVSDELFADVPAIQSYINARMRYGVEIQEDSQLLVGDGVGANLTGILNTAGIQTQAKGADTVPDAIRKAMTKVQSVGFFAPDGIVIHPNDWEAICLLKDASGQYLAGGPFYLPYGNGQFVMVYRLWGLPVVVTTSITENTALVGAFKLGAMIFRREGISLDSTNSNEDDFKKNLVALRAEERLALAVWRPKAFCQVTGI